MKIFSGDFFSELTDRAQNSSRLRQHQNIHGSLDEPCQRLFNAIEPDSYIRPHRHASDPRDEMLVAVRGLMAVITFDELGEITDCLYLGGACIGPQMVQVVELPPTTWHTVVALESGSVLLEIKAGPFDSSQPKNLAAWAPEEGSAAASRYLEKLKILIKQPASMAHAGGLVCCS